MKDKQNPYTILNFDSKLFGYAVVRLKDDLTSENLPIVLGDLRHRGVKLAYWFVDPKNEEAARAARNYSGVLVDEKITYAIRTDTRKEQLNEGVNNIIPYKRKTVTKDLLALTLQSGRYSRFNIDPNFKRHEFKKLYAVWIRNSVQHKAAFEVLIYKEPTKQMKGMVTLDGKGSIGNIGLLAVDKKNRGQSIGTTLVITALRNFKAHGFKNVHVTTQKSNITACRFYEKLGFAILKSEHVYHFWL